DGRPDAAAPDQQPLVDHLLDGPAHGRPGQPEPLAHGHLVLERVARLEPTVHHGRAELFCELVVQRDRRAAVDPQVDGDRKGGHDLTITTNPGTSENVRTTLGREPGQTCWRRDSTVPTTTTAARRAAVTS